MNEKMQAVIRTGLFILVLCSLFIYMSGVLFPKWTDIDDTKPGINSFYAQPENSIDVVFLGTSSFRNGFSPLTIWEQTGITSNLRATAGQHPMVTYYYLQETLQYQDIKLVVVDGISLFKEFDVDYWESTIRKSVDPLRLTITKARMIFDIASYSENQTVISYFLPLLRYHDRWKEALGRNDFEFFKIDNHERFRGQYITRGYTPDEMPDYFNERNVEAEVYSKDALNYFEKLIALCKEKGIDVVFVSLPRTENYNHAKNKGIQLLAQKHGLRFYDYNMPKLIEESGFDPATEFQNATHLNVYGSQTISSHFAEMLQEEFAFEDKRGKPGYAQWDSDLAYYQSVIPVRD